MGLSIGDGIAIAAVCATIFAAIIRLIPRRFGVPSVDFFDKATLMTRDICELKHSAIDGWMHQMGDRLGRIEQNLQEVLIRMGVKPGG